jgi:hypothetical protein
MDRDKARLIAAAGQAHGHGVLIRMLLAYCATNEQQPKAWLDHIRAHAEKDMKGTVTSGLSDEESLLVVNSGLAAIQSIFDGLET